MSKEDNDGMIYMPRLKQEASVITQMSIKNNIPGPFAVVTTIAIARKKHPYITDAELGELYRHLIDEHVPEMPELIKGINFRTQ